MCPVFWVTPVPLWLSSFDFFGFCHKLVTALHRVAAFVVFANKNETIASSSMTIFEVSIERTNENRCPCSTCNIRTCHKWNRDWHPNNAIALYRLWLITYQPSWQNGGCHEALCVMTLELGMEIQAKNSSNLYPTLARIWHFQNLHDMSHSRPRTMFSIIGWFDFLFFQGQVLDDGHPNVVPNNIIQSTTSLPKSSSTWRTLDTRG